MYVRLTLLLCMATYASCAKILAFMVVPSHSHHMWNTKYLEALEKRGHHITYFGVDPYKNPPKNMRHLHVEGLYELIYSNINFNEIYSEGSYTNVQNLGEWNDQISNYLMENSVLQKLSEIIRKENFDLIVHDIVGSFFLLGAVDVLGKCPAVGITAFGVPTWTFALLGAPMAYSSKPHFLTAYSDNMNFWQRANNYFLHLFSFAVDRYFLFKENEYAKKIFGKNIRDLDDILNDINIIMVNSNYGFDFPFPSVPGLIPVGGLHIEEPKPLPQDLQSFLDESKEGVIYFSLGSNIRSANLSENTINVLIKAFGQLSPVRILWKWESDSLPGKPENVKISKWLPQNDILAHPNVRMFFTHGGMLSTQEAIYHGKPIVGMPFFLDQHVNVRKCVEKGLGEELSLSMLTTKKIVETLGKVLREPRYTESIRNSSILFRDQMEKPMERAMYWTEYAIRHKGAPHLRHSARNLNWFQNWMLDVLLATFFVLFLILFLTRKLFSGLLLLICGGGDSKQKKQ